MLTTTKRSMMPHLFTNRLRCHDLFNKNADLRDEFRWETINTVAYLLGGIVFAPAVHRLLPDVANRITSSCIGPEVEPETTMTPLTFEVGLPVC